MTTLSKEEYLKRYMSATGNNGKPKKKKKKVPKDTLRKEQGFKIVDDDIGWDAFAPKVDEFDEVDDKLLTTDEKPLVENIDVRTEEERKLDEYRRSKMWKKIGDKKKKNKPVIMRHDSDSDLELERNAIVNLHHDQTDKAQKRQRHDSDSDLEVSRKKSIDSVPSSEHKRRKKRNQKHDSDSDLDLERPPSNKTETSHSQTQMQGGGRGGLTSVDLLRLEMKKLEKKDSQIKLMAEDYKNSSTVYRERGSGKKRNIQEEKKADEEEKLRRQRKEEQYDKWGRGLKQAEMRTDAIADAIHESGKSLTRYADDEDLDAMRKVATRHDEVDPMAWYIDGKKKEKGPAKEYPKYKGPAPAPNRFKIMPGYRWDGVDRSNGFEKKYFESLSERQADKDEYYKWSVGDL